MKKTMSLLCIVALIGAALTGCGQRADSISLGPDGYGETTLANGVKVVVNRDATTSLSAIRILIGGGVLSETVDNNGITNLTTRMLLKGNANMTAAEVTEKLEFLGAGVSADCFRDYSALSFSCLTENFEEALAVVAQSLITPAFADEELTKLKLAVEGDIKALNDNQSASSSRLFWKTAYGDQGYGLPTIGTAESIAGIASGDLRAHYDRYYGGANVVVAIATDIPAEQISSLVSKHLGGLKAEAEKPPAPKPPLQDEKNGFVSYDRNQSFIYTGVALDRLQSAEVPYVILLNEVMGANVGSRLWYLRQKEKLAYSVYTQYGFDKHGGLFRAAIGTDTSKVQIALASLDREWEKLVADGITAEELADARVNMKNNLIFRIDRKSGRANNMAANEYTGYGYRYLLDLIKLADQVTLDQINDFVKTRFVEERKYTSIVGKR